MKRKSGLESLKDGGLARHMGRHRGAGTLFDRKFRRQCGRNPPARLVEHFFGSQESARRDQPPRAGFMLELAQEAARWRGKEKCRSCATILLDVCGS